MISQHTDVVLKYFNEIAVMFTVVMTFITYLLGGWDKALEGLIILVVIDIITGMLVGFFIHKDFTSKRLREGFTTKVMYLIVIAVGNVLDGVFFEQTPILRTMALWFYIYVEGMSILENIGNLGVPLPKKFIDRMGQIGDSVGAFAKMKNGKFVKDEDEK